MGRVGDTAFAPSKGFTQPQLPVPIPPNDPQSKSRCCHSVSPSQLSFVPLSRCSLSTTHFLPADRTAQSAHRQTAADCSLVRQVTTTTQYAPSSLGKEYDFVNRYWSAVVNHFRRVLCIAMQPSNARICTISKAERDSIKFDTKILDVPIAVITQSLRMCGWGKTCSIDVVAVARRSCHSSSHRL